MSSRMPPIYPHRVYTSRPERCMSETKLAHMDGTKTCCGGPHTHAGHHHPHHHGADTGGQAVTRDPVCGMSVDPATSKHGFDYRGEIFHFCSAGCRTKFAADPKKYLDAKYLDKGKPLAGASQIDVPEGTIYTCPMHPQIRQVGPGNCPICGMALEPEVASLDAGPNPELADMTRRFRIGLLLPLPASVLGLGGPLAGGQGWFAQPRPNGLRLGFVPPVVVWVGGR